MLKVDNGWTINRLFGKLSDPQICERNKELSLQKYDECISIFNNRCHLFLETGLFTLGKFLRADKKFMNHHNAISELEGTEKPVNLSKEELEVILRLIRIKLYKLKSCQIYFDKLNNFMA